MYKYNFKKLVLLFIVWGFSMFSNLSAKEYTISTANELKNLSLSAGDVVTMTNGTWSNQELTFKGNGTENNPITLKAETPGEVILTGFSKLALAGNYLIVDGLTFQDGELEGDPVVEFRTSSSSVANNSRLTNTAIINYNPWDPSEEYKWVSIYGESNQVDHCSFIGKNHAGALLVIWIGNTANYHRINNNYFADIPELGDNGAETIRIGTSTNSMKDSYAIVEHNLFEDCDGEIEIISNKSCENIYRHNTFLHCEGTLTLRHGNRCSVYGNFFFGDLDKRSGGVRIIGEDHKVYNNYFQDLMSDGFRSAISLTNGVPDSPLNRYFQVKNPKVVNNTIVNCRYGITIGAGVDGELSLPPQNVFLANNVIADYEGRMQKAIDYDDTPEGISYVNNMIYGSKLGDTPDDVDNSNPKLEVSDDFYRPADDSPVIGFGVDNMSFVTEDIEGQSRSTGNDAGCDQVSDIEIIHTPFLRYEVGGSIGVNYEISDNTGYPGGEETLPDSTSYKLDIVDAIASTEQNETGKVNIAENSIDGYLSTRWSGEGIGAYIDLFLDKEYDVSFIKIGHYKGDERTASFHLLAWNNTTEVYDTLLSNVNSAISSNDFSIYDFDNVDTDIVRLVGLGYSGGTGIWNSYTEFELWGREKSNPTEITQVQNKQFMVIYPNPSLGSFYIKNCTNANLEIYSLSGARMFSQANINSEDVINLKLKPGTYLVKVDSSSGTYVDKLILM